MSPLFRRRRGGPADDEPTAAAGETEAEEAPAPPATGPFDADSDVPEGRRVDLGALRVPVLDGTQLQLEVDKASRAPRAAAVVDGPSRVRLSAYAAPRSRGVWDEVRAEIAGEVTKIGGTAREVEGEFGTEVLATIPTKLADGRQAVQVQRFAGIDGPRWFLRAVFSGPEVVRAAGLTVPEDSVDEERVHRLEAAVRDCVVVRGGQARPPREPLPLAVPAGAHPPASVAPVSGAGTSGSGVGSGPADAGPS